MKDGKSFTELLKALISECTNKGDANSILTFLKTKGPLSEESAENITKALERGRTSAVARKIAE
jgi:hypothetical protein